MVKPQYGINGAKPAPRVRRQLFAGTNKNIQKQNQNASFAAVRGSYDRARAMGGADPGPKGPVKRGKTVTKVVTVKKTHQKPQGPPVARYDKNRTRAPRIHNGDGHIIVEHREFIGDVVTDINNDFAYDVYDINPGAVTTFPWLSVIAGNYESYTFERCDFEYRPASGSQVSGKLLFAIDYDAADAASSETKQSLLQWEGACDSQVWEPLTIRSTRAQLNKIGPTRFIQASVSAFAEGRLSSAGLLYVGTTSISGLQPSAVAGQFVQGELGELWCEYRVKLITAQTKPNSNSFTLGNPGVPPFVDRPQFFSSTNLIPIPSTTNAIRGLTPTATFDISEQRPSNFALNTNYGAQIVDVPANALVNDASQLLTTQEKCIRFDKDFVGQMELAWGLPSPIGGAIPSTLNITPYKVFSSDLNNAPKPDAPNLSATYFAPIIQQASTTIMNMVFKGVVQAGTFLLLRFANPYSWAGGSGGLGFLTLNSRKFASIELLGGNVVGLAYKSPLKVGNFKPSRSLRYADQLAILREQTSLVAQSATEGAPSTNTMAPYH